MNYVTLSDGTSQVRVPQADSYPGYDGWTASDPYEYPTLATLQAAAWERVKAIRDAKNGGTCSTTFGEVQCDAESRGFITGLVVMASVQGMAFAVNFTMADNAQKPLSASDMTSLGVAVGTYIDAVHDHSIALRDAINAAPDATALDAIDITAGWP